MLVEPVGVVGAEAERETGLVVPGLLALEGHGADTEPLEVHRHLVARAAILLSLHCRSPEDGHRGGQYYCRFCCFHDVFFFCS